MVDVEIELSVDLWKLAVALLSGSTGYVYSAVRKHENKTNKKIIESTNLLEKTRHDLTTINRERAVEVIKLVDFPTEEISCVHPEIREAYGRYSTKRNRIDSFETFDRERCREAKNEFYSSATVRLYTDKRFVPDTRRWEIDEF